MVGSLQETSLKKNLRLILSEGIAASLMVGIGESYLAAFVLALGMGDVTAGLLATLPLMAGAILQLVSPYAVTLLHSHKKWVIFCASLQSACFVPLAFMALWAQGPAALIFAVASVYWGCALGWVPAWNSWMGHIVPKGMRPTFFARRSRLAHGAVLIGLFLGGMLLHEGDRLHRPLLAFASIFILAGWFRYLSVRLIRQQTEVLVPRESHRRIPLHQVFSRVRHRADGRLLQYMIWLNITVNIASPYFTPFMLQELKLTYGRYMLLIAASFLAKMIFLPFHGWIARRQGAGRLLWIGGICAIPLPLLWVLSNSFSYLLICQMISGFGWAAYELGVFLLYFETIEEGERTSLLTSFNLINSFAVFLGALLGGALLDRLGHGRDAYVILFAVSCGARLITFPLLRRLKWVRADKQDQKIQEEVLAVRPSAGSIGRPVLETPE